jgi:nitroimidazol reductase NimA-like FMN-containing flavoprotein (pyridoxamine 5'-phosphate oxidase superfamily)
MATSEPATELDSRYSSGEAAATPWAVGRDHLERAEIYWLSTVRPDGQPHVTPLIAVWQDGALYFSTGPDERKAKNLAQNPHCVITTGNNSIGEGLDVVLEGRAVEVNDEGRLRELAAQYKAKYDWEFSVRDGAFHNDEGGRALVFEVAPVKVLGFGKGDTFSQTRWRFE